MSSRGPQGAVVRAGRELWAHDLVVFRVLSLLLSRPVGRVAFDELVAHCAAALSLIILVKCLFIIRVRRQGLVNEGTKQTALTGVPTTGHEAVTSSLTPGLLTPWCHL